MYASFCGLLYVLYHQTTLRIYTLLGHRSYFGFHKKLFCCNTMRIKQNKHLEESSIIEYHHDNTFTKQKL